MPPFPEPAAVTVWWADLTQAHAGLLEGLPAAERARVEELTTQADRGRRLLGAVLLQHAVGVARGGRAGGRAVGGPVEVGRTCDTCGAPHGRPVVAGGPYISVAHAGVLVVVAACATAAVGVDVERVGPADADLSAWVEREAQLKAGDGAGAPGVTPLEVVHLEPPLPGYLAALAAPEGSVVQVERWPGRVRS